jgi:inosose dehydratase
MAAAGFTGCEVGNKYPKDPGELKTYLQPRKLEIASAWFSSFFTEHREKETITDFQKHMAFLKAMGAKVIVVCECGHCIQGKALPVLDEKPVFSNNQWDQLEKGLATLGRMAADHDMSIVYHYHMGTGVQTASEVDRLMAATDPQLVSLLLDTGHAYYTGDDPLAIFEKHATRVKHIHLKDIRETVLQQVKQKRMSFLDSVKEGVFTVPGDGVIDFPPVFRAIQDIDYQGWLIVEAEQDPEKAPPLEYARMARKFIKEQSGL